MNKKTRITSAIMFFIMILFISGCDDTLTGEVIGGETDKNATEQLSDEQEKPKGQIIGVEEDTINEQENTTSSGKTQTDINTTEEANTTEDEYPVAKRPDGDIKKIELDDEEFEFGRLRTFLEGDKHIISVNNNTHEIQLIKVTSGGGVMFELDGLTTDLLDSGQRIDLERGFYIEVGDGLYNHPLTRQKSMAEITYKKENFESYEDYLVEEDVGSFEYLYSEKKGEDYHAYYSRGLKVTIRQDYNFMRNYPDEENLYLFDNDEYIYRVLDDSDNIVEIAWSSDDYTVQVNRKSDLVTERYLKKYPTDLSEEAYCTEEHNMLEYSKESFTVLGEEYDIELIQVHDEDMNVKFMIDDEYMNRVDEGEKLEIAQGLELEIKKIWLDYVSEKDRIKFCFLYEED